MSRRILAVVLASGLGACSSGVQVDVNQVGQPLASGCPAPEQRICSYRTCTQAFDPLGWSHLPYTVMRDAASTAPLLALGPGPLAAGALLPTASGVGERLAGALSTEMQLLDQRRALVEFGQLLATTPPGVNGQTTPSPSLQAALDNRLARLLVGPTAGITSPPTTTSTTTTTAMATPPATAPAATTPSTTLARAPAPVARRPMAARDTAPRCATPTQAVQPFATSRPAAVPVQPSPDFVRAMAQHVAANRARSSTVPAPRVTTTASAAPLPRIGTALSVRPAAASRPSPGA